MDPITGIGAAASAITLVECLGDIGKAALKAATEWKQRDQHWGHIHQTAVNYLVLLNYVNEAYTDAKAKCPFKKIQEFERDWVKNIQSCRETCKELLKFYEEFVAWRYEQSIRRIPELLAAFSYFRRSRVNKAAIGRLEARLTSGKLQVMYYQQLLSNIMLNLLVDRGNTLNGEIKIVMENLNEKLTRHTVAIEDMVKYPISASLETSKIPENRKSSRRGLLPKFLKREKKSLDMSSIKYRSEQNSSEFKEQYSRRLESVSSESVDQPEENNSTFDSNTEESLLFQHLRELVDETDDPVETLKRMIEKLKVQPAPERTRPLISSSPICENIFDMANHEAEEITSDVDSQTDWSTIQSSQEEISTASQTNDLLASNSSFALCAVNEYWGVLCFQNAHNLIQYGLIPLNLEGEVLLLGEIDEAVKDTPLYCYERQSRICIMYVSRSQDTFYLMDALLPVQFEESDGSAQSVHLVTLESPQDRIRRIKAYDTPPGPLITGMDSQKVIVERGSEDLSSLKLRSQGGWLHEDSVGWIAKGRIPGTNIAFYADFIGHKKITNWGLTHNTIYEEWIVYGYVNEEGISLISESTDTVPPVTLKTVIPVQWETISDKTQIKLRIEFGEFGNPIREMAGKAGVPWSTILCGYFYQRENTICYVQGEFTIGGDGSFETPQVLCDIKDNTKFEFVSLHSRTEAAKEAVELEAIADGVWEVSDFGWHGTYLAYFSTSGSFVLSQLGIVKGYLKIVETIDLLERHHRLPFNPEDSTWGLQLTREPLDARVPALLHALER